MRPIATAPGIPRSRNLSRNVHAVTELAAACGIGQNALKIAVSYIFLITKTLQLLFISKFIKRTKVLL